MLPSLSLPLAAAKRASHPAAPCPHRRCWPDPAFDSIAHGKPTTRFHTAARLAALAAPANWATWAICASFAEARDSGTMASLHPPEHADGLDRHAEARRAPGAGGGSDCARLGLSERCGHHRAPRRRQGASRATLDRAARTQGWPVCTSSDRLANTGAMLHCGANGRRAGVFCPAQPPCSKDEGSA